VDGVEPSCEEPGVAIAAGEATVLGWSATLFLTVELDVAFDPVPDAVVEQAVRNSAISRTAERIDVLRPEWVNDRRGIRLLTTVPDPRAYGQ
jgi:hypothetical protein